MEILFTILIAIAVVLISALVWRILNSRYQDEARRTLQIFGLHRHSENPILHPDKDNNWESEGVLNPAVIKDDDGVVHILYRAIGADGVSRIGYTKSLDGKNFDGRLPYPVFEPRLGFDLPTPEQMTGPKKFDRNFYTSGGSWGGSEDPRAVLIDNTVYMTYVAFGGWNSIRIALTSIPLSDLKQKKWRWKRPVLISPPNVASKNWVLFPEKINGKFAVLHGISPKIMIDYVDNFEQFRNGDYIKSLPSHGGRGYQDPRRDKYWDNLVRGAGPPPVKTHDGWLLLYHAIDKNDPGKYKVGAMLLDLNDPTIILRRSDSPILSPEMHYENDGKPGVVYASGAVIKNDDLHVYYGGGDKTVNCARRPVMEILEYLKGCAPAIAAE